MNFCKGVLATQLLVALALAGCGSDLGTKDADGKGNVGRISARLTLPDGTTINNVHYNITGPFATMGDVPVGDSTILTFRVGGLPVDAANPYHIALTASTTGMPSESCTGGADFSITSNKMPTLVNMVLTCGEALDPDGDVIINGMVVATCPVVTAITALPGEVTLTHSVALTAATSSPTTVLWTGAGGTFGTATALATTYTCVDAGVHTLTVEVTAGSCDDSYTVDIICTGVGPAVCGNSAIEAGETCDDGNTTAGDGCSATCQTEVVVTPVCGNSMIEAPETCDDGNTTAGDGCSATCLIEVVVTPVCGNSAIEAPETCDDGNTTAGDGCSAVCQTEVPGAVCGNGATEAGETCDDSNMVTETCTYGQTSCTVCNSACQSVAGATAFCGDSTTNGTEECDDGAAGSATCTPTCTTIGVDVCGECRTANCTTYQGVDFVAGCFSTSADGVAARDMFGATFTPTQIDTCVNAMACAEMTGCGKTPNLISDDCYCGPFHTGFGLDECMMAGPEAPGGVQPPCRDEWEAAAGSTVVGTVLASISDLSTPLGWSYFLLECEQMNCATECP